MKKLFLLCSTVLVTLFASASVFSPKPGLGITELSNGYFIDFTMPEYQVVTDTVNGDYYFSSIMPYVGDCFDHIDIEGRPVLPFYSVNLILPSEVTNIEVTVQILDSSIIILPLDYTPAQGLFDPLAGCSYDNDFYTGIDSIWYKYYYEISEINVVGYSGLSFSMFPCRYEPVTRKLTVYNKATYEITYSGDNLLTYKNYDLSQFEDLRPYNYFDNFTDYPIQTPPITDDEYLIITADDWANDYNLFDFISHKEALGYNVTLATVSEAGYTAENIRAYIKMKHNDCGIKFVLLVGDPERLPYSYGIQQDVDDPPTDMFYSCLSEDDIDDQWADLNPTVYVGRWSVVNSSELGNVVVKTIHSDLFLGDEAPSQLSLFSGLGPCGYSSSSYNTLKYVYNLALDLGYDADLYDGRTLASSGHYLMMNRLSSDEPLPTWMFVYAGGGGDSYGIGAPYMVNHLSVDSLDTESLAFQPFGFGFAPLLGNAFVAQNFAWAWVSSQQGGVTFMGSTTDVYRDPERYFVHRLFDQLENRPVMTIGEFVSNGKAKYYNACRVVSRRREAKKHVLYGDPSLYLYGLDLLHHIPHPKPAIRYELENNIEKSDEILSVQVYSILGQLILNSSTPEIDLTALPSGSYFKVINTENGQISEKIVVK